MRTLVLAALAAIGVGCATPADGALCGDAAFWSERAASWPTDAVFVGGQSLGLTEALDLLERDAASAEDRLGAALVVAELNLASGADDRLLPLVYEGHALLSDGAELGEDGDALAEALSAERICP